MKKILLALVVAAPIVGFSQWKSTSVKNATIKEGKEKIETSGLYTLDNQLFKNQLANAPERFSNLPGNVISIPNSQGNLEKFEVWEASNFTPELQAKFPDIRAYVGIGIDDPSAYLRFSYSPKGISSMTLRSGKSEFIEPYTTDDSVFAVFDSKAHRNQGEVPFECKTPESTALTNDINDLATSQLSSAGVFKTFRLAQSCTGEYGQYFGGTVAGAMTAINNTVTRVNAVFEKDFALNVILIDNNEAVVYLDPATDPYSPATGMNSWNGQLQSTLNSVIGAANYDIGHLFGRSGGGGNAGCIGCVCNDSNKGSGITSPGSGGPEGDNFDIDYVAHEMGHQLGATHSFTWEAQPGGTQVEPGSGSSIMGYAGIVPGLNVQAHSDDNFTYRNLTQVQTNLQNKPCANNTTMANQAPVVSAGENYNIPVGTAFVLRGTGSDPDGNPLEYIWEQNDAGSEETSGQNSKVGFTKTTGPNFRMMPYTAEPVRYFPKFEYVLDKEVTSEETYWKAKWEAITTVPRVYNFAFTARDINAEGGQTNSDLTRITVKDAGPFKILTPANAEEVVLNPGTMNVTWDVAGTDGGEINTANVKISFSSDNGATFTVVSENTPNDGSETIAFPAGTVAGTNARIMIEAVGNIYYAVSRKFTLTGNMGVSDVNHTSEISVYPNPNHGQFAVNAKNMATGSVVTKIFDTSGKMIYNQTVKHAGGEFNQNYNLKLPTGVYIINLESAGKITTQKLIINN